MIVGIDAGNHKVKIVGAYGSKFFHSNICEWFEQDVHEFFGPDDMEFEFDGRKGYAGTIAIHEDEFGGNMMGDTKAHEDAKIRILLGLHQYCPDFSEISLVTGQPITGHKDTEKRAIKDMLIGERTITVNGETKTFYINNVGVAPEGSSAIWARPMEGKVRILDVGSGTVNAATVVDKKHIHTQSDTFPFGVETVISKDYKAMSRGILKNVSRKWNRQDKVLICGGIAQTIAPEIKKYFVKAEVLNPIREFRLEKTTLHPVFANAVGFYEIAKEIYS